MKNQQLKRDLNTIIQHFKDKNISHIGKGGISGNSIEINYIEPISFDTYVYYGDSNDCLSDYDELKNVINNLND